MSEHNACTIMEVARLQRLVHGRNNLPAWTVQPTLALLVGAVPAINARVQGPPSAAPRRQDLEARIVTPEAITVRTNCTTHSLPPSDTSARSVQYARGPGLFFVSRT